ncbi:unnamed protein product, partial [Ectocarpus sp. 12 AP-2014]
PRGWPPWSASERVRADYARSLGFTGIRRLPAAAVGSSVCAHGSRHERRGLCSRGGRYRQRRVGRRVLPKCRECRGRRRVALSRVRGNGRSFRAGRSPGKRGIAGVIQQ